MSATDYSVCLERNREEVKRLKSEIEQQYGKLPLDDFLKYKQATEALILQWDARPETLEERYYTHMSDDGMLTVKYKAQCTECSFGYAFDVEKNAMADYRAR